MLTLQQAKCLKTGQILHHVSNVNRDGTPQRWKVTSVKTWKSAKNAHRVEIRLKHGLKTFDQATEDHLHLLKLPE